MTEEIEVQNFSDHPILVSVCRSKLSGRLFVHVGKFHGGEIQIDPQDYVVVTVRTVEV